MNLKKKTNFWVENKLITKEQQQAILKKEEKRFLPFVLLSFLWLGILCFFVGFLTLVYAHWNNIADWIKLLSLGLLGIVVCLGVFYALKNRKKIMFETALFFSFFMIGGGIGLCTQVFNLPLMTHQGLLLWAFLSLGIVLVSKKEFLFLLWIPLFLGGLLGSLKLELLLLFFEQSPLFSTVVLAAFFFVLLFLTRKYPKGWLSPVYKWSVAFYIMVVFLGDRAMSNVFMGLVLFFFCLLLLIALAIKERRVILFNIVSFCVVVRLIWFYFQLSDSLHLTGTGFLSLGVIILLFCGIWVLFEKKLSSKPIF